VITEAPSAASPVTALRLRGSSYVEVKDPCPLKLGPEWHLFGTGVTAPHTFEILHARSTSQEGPWELVSPVTLPAGLSGGCLAAPGMHADGAEIHMFLQTDYDAPGGRIEHLRSGDAGASFSFSDTALCSTSGAEAGVYDPHPAEIDGERYLTYSAFSVVGEPDIHLARSSSRSWNGPWERLGPILRHDDVPFHNPRGRQGYEWGLEGAQLLALPDGRVLMNAVCFLEDGPAGSRQRVFTALAPHARGPYTALAPILTPAGAGENGHATAILDDQRLTVFLQERDGPECPWRYGFLRLALEDLPGIDPDGAAAG
jgi:hypothetical protein